MSYNNFPRKGYGAIFVENQEDVERVKNIIREMDEFEYGYLPENFIKPFVVETTEISGKEHYVLRLNYTHKFDDLDLNELLVRCWGQGIKAFCCMSGSSDLMYYQVFNENT